MAELAILLRNGQHGTSGTIRYALKASDIAMSLAKTPIQIPIPQQSPELVDIGYFRPSITVTGIVDTVGNDTNNVTAGFAGMSSFMLARTSYGGTASGQYNDGGSATAQRYYIPYKNALEETCQKWIFASNTLLELEVGDAQFPISNYGGYLGHSGSSRFTVNNNNHATGGAIYRVALQQARFQVNAAKEDRYEFSLQFVSEGRLDIP